MISSTCTVEWRKKGIQFVQKGSLFLLQVDDYYGFGEGYLYCCCFNIAGTATWERLNVIGSPPIAQSSSTVLHEKKLITFGGIIGGKAQNSLHSLNLSVFYTHISKVT